MQWTDHNFIFTKVISDIGLPYIVARYQYNAATMTSVWQVYAHEKITRLLPVKNYIGEVSGTEIPVAEVEAMIAVHETQNPVFIGESI